MNFKPLLILPPLALGVAGFMWMTAPRDTDAPPVAEARLAVRAVAVQPEALPPRVTGYGRVAPVQQWTALAEVQGRITALAPDLTAGPEGPEGLDVGTVVPKGATLIEIDRTDAELALAKAEAAIASAQSTLSELDRTADNTRRSLEVQTRILAVAEAEYARTQELLERGTGTRAALDAAEKTLLNQQNSVVSLENTLALLPTQRGAAEATLATRAAEKAEAERTLARTVITAPFRGRVASISAEVDQFARSGDQLLTLEGTEAVEIVAEMTPSDFQPLAATLLDGTALPDMQIDTTRVVEFLRAANVRAEVRVTLGDRDVVYDAELVRFRGTIDASTGTLGVAVRVADPLIANRSRRQPPLNVGMFASVVLTGPAQADVIAIPRAALRQGDDGAPFVYVADAEDRLAIRPVVTGTVLDDRIVVLEGLAPGARLILSDPRPPVPGLALDVVLPEQADVPDTAPDTDTDTAETTDDEAN